MGPTASGKTDVAMRLADAYPFDLVSVDSALVYRGMNIGTAKPGADTLRRYPHRLVDIRDPEQPYSAGEFVRDAEREIDAILKAGRLPLLVGGTMMYFRALIDGIAALPKADQDVRNELDREARALGWPELHKQLAEADAEAAARISPNDSQRIQRALEVYRISGRSLTDWQSAANPSSGHYSFIKLALLPEPRAALHARIEKRLQLMLGNGFLAEVAGLKARPGLTARHSSMRAVGYRQYWSHLDGEYDARTARSKALAATRQLAKRQITWLRSERQVLVLNPLEVDPYDAISAHLDAYLKL